MHHTLLPCLTYINSFNCVLEAYIKAVIVGGIAVEAILLVWNMMNYLLEEKAWDKA